MTEPTNSIVADAQAKKIIEETLDLADKTDQLDALLEALDRREIETKFWPATVKFGARLAVYEDFHRRLTATV